VIVVDPRAQTIAVHDRSGVRELRGDDVLTHDSLPGFELGVGRLFERAKS
jgi:hypothetical protein